MSTENNLNGFSHVFALLIGINKYDGNHKLNGAVNDVKSMDLFIKTRLNANPNNIKTLLDGDATRKGILDALEDLANNNEIREDDPIIIFFAGHGTRKEAPKEWNTRRTMVEMICPSDMTFIMPGAEDSQRLEPDIYGIPDRTIAAYMNHLSRKKGSNITFILDCCHAAGANRAPPSRLTVRTIDPSDHPDLPVDCDSDIIKRYKDSRDSTRDSKQTSHILLAACGETQFAQESPSKDGSSEGLFTKALLEKLQEETGHNRTYKSLIGSIKIENQTPQCFGVNQGRLLFNLKPLGQDILLLHGHQHNHHKGGGIPRFVLEAGIIHNMKTESRFRIYHTIYSHNLGVPAGYLQLASPAALHGCFSELEFCGEQMPHDLPRHFFAREIETISVMCNDYSRLEKTVKEATLFNQSYIDLHPLQITKPGPNDATTSIQVAYRASGKPGPNKDSASDYVYFERPTKDPAISILNSQLGDGIPNNNPQQILNFIHCATRFYRHLFTTNSQRQILTYLTPNGRKYTLQSGVKVAFHRLQPGGLEWDMEMAGPNRIIGDNKVEIDLKTEAGTQWGMKIENNTPKDFYLHLFIFDASDLSIEPWYLPSSGYNSACPTCAGDQETGRVDYCIKANSTISIGDNDDFAPPMVIDHNATENNVKILKMYLTNEAVDLGSIAQKSPSEFIPEKQAFKTISQAERESEDNSSETLTSRGGRPAARRQNSTITSGSMAEIDSPDMIWFTKTIRLIFSSQ